MLNAIRYEFVRLRSLRSTWLLVGAALVLQLLLALLNASFTEFPPAQRFNQSFLSGMLILVTLCSTAVGVAAFGHEYRYRTITTTVLTLRSRTRILAAKALTVAAVAAGTGAALVAVSVAVASTYDGIPADLSRVGQILVGVVLFTLLTALFGLGVAAVTRHATIAMVTVVAFPLIVETALAAGLKVDPRLLPFQAAVKLPAPFQADPWLLPLPLLTLTAMLLGTGGVLLARRDV